MPTQTPSNQPPSQLQLLATDAKNQKPDSSQRHRALTALIQEVWKQPTIGILRASLRTRYSNLSAGLFEDLFNDALQVTFVKISCVVDRFDSRRLFLPFISTIISNKFSDLYKKHCNHGVTCIPRSTGNHNSIQCKVISLDELDEFLQDQIMNEHFSNFGVSSTCDCDLLRELLIKDPNNEFQVSVRDKPDITFQYIAIRLYVEGIKMQQLVEELEVPYQTLNSFFKRNLERLEPYFREKLQH